MVMIVSLRNYIYDGGWPTEMFGFVWGIILVNRKEWFAERVKRRWLPISTILCIIAGIFGIMYLKFKPVPFYGDYLLKNNLGLVIMAFILAVNVRMAFRNRVSLFLESISYEVYLLHESVFGMLAFIAPGISSGMFIGFSIVITVEVSWVIRMVGTRVIKIITTQK